LSHFNHGKRAGQPHEAEAKNRRNIQQARRSEAPSFKILVGYWICQIKTEN